MSSITYTSPSSLVSGTFIWTQSLSLSCRGMLEYHNIALTGPEHRLLLTVLCPVSFETLKESARLVIKMLSRCPVTDDTDVYPRSHIIWER